MVHFYDMFVLLGHCTISLTYMGQKGVQNICLVTFRICHITLLFSQALVKSEDPLKLIEDNLLKIHIAS